MKLTKTQRAKVEKALANHERFQGVYHWRPESNANARRSLERKGAMSISFRNGGHEYCYRGCVRCSCSHTEYSGEFTLDGVKKDVRLFKALVG